IEFKPEEDFQPGKLYEVSFELGKLRTVAEKFKEFNFNIQIIRPSFSIEDNGLRAQRNSKDRMSLSGTLLTADVEEGAKIEKVLKASIQGNELKINWVHNEAGKTHEFLIDSIKRGKGESRLSLAWNGNPLKATLKGQKE